MKKNIYKVLVLAVVFCIPYLIEYQSYYTQFNPWARLDFSRLCSLSEELVKAEQDPIRRYSLLIIRIDHGFYSPSTKNIVNVLPMARAEKRKELFHQAMREIGFPDYECPPLMKILNIQK